MASLRLSNEQQSFFRLVAGTALANPPGPEQLELVSAIVKATPGTPRDETLHAVAQKPAGDRFKFPARHLALHNPSPFLRDLPAHGVSLD